jgi:glucosamine--fructose-6-phosphate aminotransferase (isomerizing)
MDAMDNDSRLEDWHLPGEIGLQPSVIRRVLDIVDPIAESIARELASRQIRDIVMTGCGDSLFAAMGAAFSFGQFSSRLATPLHALEYSRGLYRTSGPQTLVCALSYSGETRRTLEASIAARSQQACLVAITVDGQGSIANLADHVLPNVVARENQRSNCGTGSYQATYLALVLLSAHMAVQEQRMEAGRLDTLHESILALASTMERSREDLQRRGREAAATLRAARTVFFLGGGEAHAAALYASAKLYETSSLPSIAQEMEQFAHEEIFSLEPDSVAIILALRGPFLARAVEVADAIRRIGSRVISVSDDAAFAEHADMAITVNTAGFRAVAACLAVVPLQWMAFFDAVSRGQNPDLVRHKAVNSPLIREVPIWSTEDYGVATTDAAMHEDGSP